MEQFIESESVFVKKKIEEEFNGKTEYELEKFFDKFETDEGDRTRSFIEYYNKTVLDKGKINFGEFKRQWAIQGMKKEVFSYFDKNLDRLKEEILREKDIRKFFDKYCCTIRKEASFCSKLFHTILPFEFPPVDNPIRRRFNLQNEDFITSVLIIKRGYELFIKENPELINLIRKILSKSKFSYLRINELSDIRILDMYYWFKENREGRSPASYASKSRSDFSV